MGTILRIKDLDFGFENELLFSKLNLTITDSTWVGVIGPNGCGKTTLLKLILKEYVPQKGSVECLVDPKHIGYVPQLNPLNDDLPISVLDVVLMGKLSKLSWFGRYKQIEIQEAKYWLKQVDLADVAFRPFSTLSGGQKKRVLIARALICEPKLLILDEPTSGVDKASKEQIYETLSKLKTTIIQVTHEIEAIIHKVDLVLSLIDGGQLLEPREICEHFAKGLYHTPLIESSCS